MSLARVERMPAGAGALALSGFVRGVDADLTAGAVLRYDHHLRRGLALFAEGHAAYSGRLDYGASAGLSFRW